MTKNLGIERDANCLERGPSCLSMCVLLRSVLACGWLAASVMPASGQLDRIGGAVEFRAPDRPIPAPTLGPLDAKSSDLTKLLPTGVPADALKQIDRELGRTSMSSTTEADIGRRDSTSKTGERPNQRGLEGTTFR